MTNKNLKISYENDNVIIKSKYFSPYHCFTSGQTFRWKQTDDGFFGVVQNKAVYITNDNEITILHNISKQDFDEFWFEYFDFKRDYLDIHTRLSKNSNLEYVNDICKGLRILKQPLFDTIICFIISANNNIPRISKTVEGISKKYGTAFEYDGQTYYSFPTAEQLGQSTEEELKELGTGYRARYIQKTARFIAENKNCLTKALSYDDKTLKEFLLTLSGVGPKVSDCIMLFAYSRWGTFPADTWIKNTVSKYYQPKKDEKPEKQTLRLIKELGDDAGFIQQLIFHYERNNARILEYLDNY